MINNRLQFVSVKLWETTLVYLVMLMFLLPSSNILAQRNTFVNVRIEPKSVMYGEPFKVTIGVYTLTWFQTAPNFGDFHVPNSFTVQLGRPLSTFDYFNNKRYTSLQYTYLVYPAQIGEVIIPSLTVNFNSPPEGDHRAVPIELQTPERRIQVQPPLEGIAFEDWMISQNVAIFESWSRSLKDLKVGDVIERVITVRARGTLGALISPLKQPEVDWGSVYPKTPQVNNELVDNRIDGTRIERISYLAEKEGIFALPEITIRWWHPQRKQIYERSLPAHQITIRENPDLSVLRTMQDSLASMDNQIKPAEQKKSFTILGFTFQQFFLGLILLVLIALFSLKIIKRWYAGYKIKREDYLKSEAAYFKEFHKAIDSNDLPSIKAELMSWLDQISPENRVATLADFVVDYGDDRLKESVNELERALYGKYKENVQRMWSSREFYKLVQKARKSYLRGTKNIIREKQDLPAINPTYIK